MGTGGGGGMPWKRSLIRLMPFLTEARAFLAPLMAEEVERLNGMAVDLWWLFVRIDGELTLFGFDELCRKIEAVFGRESFDELIENW
jgi:hypothetical protein